MPISTSIQGSLSLGVNGGFGWALRLPAGAQWVVEDGKFVVETINGKNYRLYEMGVFSFTPNALNTDAAIGAIAGTFNVAAPGGYPATITVGDIEFSTSGMDLVVAAPLQRGTYLVRAVATSTNGWKWTKTFAVFVSAPPIVLADINFSKKPQIGVPFTHAQLLGTVINNVPDEATIVCNIGGVALDSTVRPVVVVPSSIPAVSGTVANGLVITLGAQTLTVPVDIFGPAPVNPGPPTLSGSTELGGTLTCAPNALAGATSIAYRYFHDGGGPIDGAWNQSYINALDDLGESLECRVTYFIGYLGTQVFTAPVGPITAPVVVPEDPEPEFTADPLLTLSGTLTSSARIGETLTSTVGEGVGAPTVRYLANNVIIEGVSGAGYVIQWADRYKEIVSEVIRTNEAGRKVVARSNPITILPELSAAYHGTPSWFSGATMRYMTSALATPMERGKNGTQKIGTGSSTRNLTFDKRIDVYIRGEEHIGVGGAPIGFPIILKGGRNGVFTAYSSAGKKIAWNGAYGAVHFLGVEADFNEASDFLFYGGLESDPASYQTTYIQGCRGTRIIGTYANPYIVPNNPSSGLNAATIHSIQRINSTQVRIMIGAIPTGGRAPLPMVAGKYKGYLIIFGVQVSAGVTTDLNVDWNTNYEIVSYNSGTGEIIAIPTVIGDGKAFPPAVLASGIVNTGTAVILEKKADNHSDFGQKGPGIAGPTYGHNNTAIGNYTAYGVDGHYVTSDNILRNSCINIKRYLGYNPQEYKAQLIYVGLAAGSAHEREFTNVFIDDVWTGVTLSDLMFPGTSQGSVLSIVDGDPFLAFGGAARSNWKGGVKLKSVPDYAPARDNWLNWSWPFHGQRNPVNADMTGITLDNATVAASAPQGTEIGQLHLANALPFADGAGRYPTIYDFAISGPNAGKVQLGYSGLLSKGAAAHTAGVPFDILVTATVRGSAANYGAAVTHGPVTITITPN